MQDLEKNLLVGSVLPEYKNDHLTHFSLADTGE